MSYMTDGLTFNTLAEANTARAKQFRNSKGKKSHAKGIKEWTPEKWACALSGEVGELCNLIKKGFRGDFDPTNKEYKKDIANELADVQIYLDLLAQRLGVNLGKATIEKFNHKSRVVGAKVFIREDGSDWTPFDDKNPRMQAAKKSA